MLTKIQTWFETRFECSLEEQPSDHALQLAAAVLLLEVSAADFEQDQLEYDEITQVLKRVFQLDDTETKELISLAGSTHDASISLHEFVSLLNSIFEYSQKVFLVEQMWRVAYADGRIDKYEDHVIRKLSELLYVSHKDFIKAKHRADPGSS